MPKAESLKEQVPEGLEAHAVAVKIPMDKLVPPKTSTRHFYDKESFKNLKKSIKKEGVLEPISVRMVGDKYEIIKGHHRFQASSELKKKDIPAFIIEADDKRAIVLSVLENILHRELDPLSEAIAYKEMMDQFNLKPKDIAAQLPHGIDRIRKRLKLLELPEPIARLVMEEQLKPSTAEELFRLKDDKQMIELGKEAAKHGYTQSHVRNQIKGMLSVEEAVAELQDETPSDEVEPKEMSEMRQCSSCDEMKNKAEVTTRQICDVCGGISFAFLRAMAAGYFSDQQLADVIHENYEMPETAYAPVADDAEPKELTEEEIQQAADSADDIFKSSDPIEPDIET